MSEKFKIACVQTEPKPDYETALLKYSAFQMKLLMKVQNLLHYLSIVED